MKKYIFLTFAAFCFLLLLSACTQVVCYAPSTTPITSADTYTEIGPAQGTSWGIMIYVVPIFEPDMSGTARDRAIQNAGGDALIEVVEDNTMVSLLLANIFWTNCEGTAVKINRGGGKK